MLDYQPPFPYPKNAGSGYAGQAVSTGFYTDAGTAKLWPLQDRVLVGAAAGVNARRSGFSGLPVSLQSSASWLIRDGQLGVVHTGGKIGVGVMTRRSDNTDGDAHATIGVGAIAINDVTSGSQGVWGGYFEVQHENTALTSHALGVEIAVKNATGTDVIPTPYNGGGTGACHGLWLAGGSDNAYGPLPTNPSASAIFVKNNDSTWNAGLVFGSESLTDKGGGVYYAICMARGQNVMWFQGTGTEAFAIRSTGNTDGQYQRIIADVRTLTFTGNDDRAFFKLNALNGNNVNRLEITSAGSGDNPILSVTGTAANLGIDYQAKGTGSHVFESETGTHFEVVCVPNSVNYLTTHGDIAGAAPTLAAAGADTDIAVLYTTKGAANHSFYSNAFGALQFQVLHTASAVNRLTATGSATGTAVNIGVIGSDPNIDIQLTPKNSGTVRAPNIEAILGANTPAAATVTTLTAQGVTNVNVSNNVNTNINTGTSTGSVTIGGANASVGFFGATAVVKQATFTQTYATAATTVAAPTAAALTDSSGGTPAGTIADAGAAYDQTNQNDFRASISTRINQLVADLANLKQVQNALIDSNQAYGLNG